MSDLLEKFTKFIEQHQLIQEQDHVLVAVSGGIDSVVLFHLLFELSDLLRLKLEIIHLNHGLRGDQADRDQQFVQQLANRYELPFLSRKVNIPRFIARKNLSEEEGARILRYRFFEWALKKTEANCLALGHHADDQVETIIDHFLRGSGVKGLSGMPIRRDRFIRPLLFTTRQEIETYAKSHSLHYIIDSTNVMVKYRRNRIRHELIPYLKQHFNPAIDDVVFRSATIMNEVEIYLNDQAQLALEKCLVNIKKNKIILDINSFLNYFIIIQKYMLFQILDRLQLSRSILTTQRLDRIQQLILERVSGKRFQLNTHWEIWIDHNQLVIIKEPCSDFEIDVTINKIVPLLDGDLKFSARLITKDQFPDRFSEDKTIEYVDYDKIEGNLKIRNFRNGDRFHPLKFKGEKKLSDFFTDQKIPLHQRKEIPLLVCDSGIVWIMGYQIDDRFKITSNTEQILKLQLNKEASV
jgi:tRNA(Ile)-lysidine synthase